MTDGVFRVLELVKLAAALIDVDCDFVSVLDTESVRDPVVSTEISIEGEGEKVRVLDSVLNRVALSVWVGVSWLCVIDPVVATVKSAVIVGLLVMFRLDTLNECLCSSRRCRSGACLRGTSKRDGYTRCFRQLVAKAVACRCL